MMIANHKEDAMRDKSYWETVSKYGVPVEDRDRLTCEGDTGHGPCGTYRDWGRGVCAKGHLIFIEGDDEE
jgi:hypothetical protein